MHTHWDGLSLESWSLLLDSRVTYLSFSLFCPPGSQEDTDCCLHSDSMCLHKACSEPTASPVCCLFHEDDLPFTARDSCVESQHGPSKKGFPVHYQKHVGHIGNTHPHLQTFRLILFTTFSSNASSPVLSLFNSIQFCHLSHWRHTRLAWLFATESVIIVG